MQKYFSYLSVLFAVTGLIMAGMAPQDVQAVAAKVVAKKPAGYAAGLYNPKKKYGDEKVAITDPASRCNTTAMRTLHAKNVTRAKEDGKSVGLTFESVSGTEVLSPVGDAYRTYLLGLNLAWEAMEEPYCGFGAFGTSAANKSYTKSVDHVRTRFLDAVKKAKLVAVKTVKK